MPGEKCVTCGAAAALRVSGTSFCASCGLQRFSDVPSNGVPTPSPATVRRRRRAAVLGIFSSGLLLKMLLGAVAVAAVGGFTASSVLQSEATAAAAQAPAAAPTGAAAAMVATTATTSNTAATVLAGLEDPAATEPRVQAAHEYAAATQVWAECVSDAASAHSSGRFDPSAACGEKPRSVDFGLDVDDDGPGNSENAPGHDDGDKKEEKDK